MYDVKMIPPGGKGDPYARERDRYGDRYAQEQHRGDAELLAQLKEEPLVIATIVEVRGKRMTIASPQGPLDIAICKGARVGDRVLCNRNTMQAMEVIADEVPVGTIVTVTAQEGKIAQGEILGTTKGFRTELTFTKGERAILDPTLGYAIGTLGMPPAVHTFGQKVSTSWEDIGGQDDAKDALREAIELPFAHPELFAAYGKRVSRGVLLSGPSGTGKTLLAKAAATSIARAHGDDASRGFFYVKGPELLSGYIGKTEEAIRRLFKDARAFKAESDYPALVFLDECDALLGSRDRGSNISFNATTVPQFLAEMDGLEESACVIVLATNRPDMLDPAVTRDGRIDRRVRVGRPSREDAGKILEIHLRGKPLLDASDYITQAIARVWSDELVVREFAGRSFRLRDFISGAVLAGMVENATTRAMARDIAGGKHKPRGISASDLSWAADRACASLRDANPSEAILEALAAEGGVAP